MTCGIYQLKFKGTDKVYIGKSLNIEERCMHHIYNMRMGTSSKKLMEAYTTFGVPKLESLIECLASELESLEKEAILVYNSVDNGFNTYREGSCSSALEGDAHPNSRYSNAQIYSVLQFAICTPEYSFRDISDKTKVSISVIENIASLKAHTWLKEVYPDDYLKLELLKNNRKYVSSKTYPKIESPLGNMFEVTNAKEFAAKYDLNHSHLVGVLNGKRKTHKGWKLPS